MGRLEVACRRFALRSGVTQEADNYSLCIEPRGATGQRKGLLMLVTEPAGNHPALSNGACKLVHEELVQHYYSDHSLSLTSSLLKALDAANSALLRQNYGEEATLTATGTKSAVAVRAGGVKTRRAQVGLTAALLRPDCEGVYLAQLAPTQAYIVHNGHLDALPEPASWRQGKVAVPLRRVPDPQDEQAAQDYELWADYENNLPPLTLPAIPLGSGPTAEVDLLYRRVEADDLIAIVSPSLARILDRQLAEEIFASGNADHAIESLHALASERGLAQAHACVLQLGVEETSGVDADLTTFAAPLSIESIEVSGGGQHTVPESPEEEPAPTKLHALRNPKQWLHKFKAAEQPPQSQIEHEVAEAVSLDKEDEANEAPSTESDDVWVREPTPPISIESRHPTRVLLERSLDKPPYQASEVSQDAADESAELEFDGWEDVPPALFPDQNEFASRKAPAYDNLATKSKLHPVPTLFDAEDDLEDTPPVAPIAQTSTSQLQNFMGKLLPAGQRAASRVASMTSNTLKGLLPENTTGRLATRQGERGVTRASTRLVIVCAVVGLLCVLALSVYGMTRNPTQAQVKQYLTQAQQEDLLANQPTTALPERLAHLEKAIELANSALLLDPKATEAQQIVDKARASQDRLQGVTRFEPKLLFDLNTSQKDAGTAAIAANGLTATTQTKLGAIELLGGDAYVLDKEQGRIYRCRIAAKDCAVALKEGDSLGGQKVGPLEAMTLRVGNLIVLDKNLAAFAYSPATSAWQAQPLGGADGLERPKDIASYDGNIYLLDAKPSQISKYTAGKYDQPPTDWITDPSGVEQTRDPVAMSIDGAIYVLLADGNVLVMQGGRVVRTLPAPPIEDDPPAKLFTSTGTQDLYILTPKTATVARMSKEGQLRAVLKPTLASGLSALSAMTVDEGSNKLYMMSNGKVYEASLRPSAPGGANQQNKPATTPAAQP